MTRPASLMREDGTLACCGGYAEHGEFCDTGREARRLEDALMRRQAIKQRWPRSPAVEAFDALAPAVERRLGELDLSQSVGRGRG